MTLKASIVFVVRKHALHNQIVGQLSSSHSVVEWPMPSKASSPCSISTDIESLVPQLDLIVIYLSGEVINNACVEYVIQTARARNIRVVGIWLEDAEQKSIPQGFEQTGDGVSPYSANLAPLFSGEQQVWLTPAGEPFQKRDIKKHTCG